MPGTASCFLTNVVARTVHAFALGVLVDPKSEVTNRAHLVSARHVAAQPAHTPNPEDQPMARIHTDAGRTLLTCGGLGALPAPNMSPLVWILSVAGRTYTRLHA